VEQHSQYIVLEIGLNSPMEKTRELNSSKESWRKTWLLPCQRHGILLRIWFLYYPDSNSI